MIDLQKIAWAEDMGRSMARTDMAKEVHTTELVLAATEAGEAFFKIANDAQVFCMEKIHPGFCNSIIEEMKVASLGSTALALVKKHPGAAIGGGLGAVHGLMNGGLGSAVGEGAVGAGLGAGAQYGLGKAMAHPELGPKINPLVDKAKGLFKKEGAHNTDKIRKALSKADPGRVSKFVNKAAGEMEKEAFGAALASLASKVAPAAGKWLAQPGNQLKAAIGGASGLSNFASARKNGEGLGSSLLSGASGAASAL